MAVDAVARQYAEEGWTVVDDVIPLAEVEQLRAILEGGGPDGGPCHGINLTLKHPAFLALARDRRITDVTRTTQAIIRLRVVCGSSLTRLLVFTDCRQPHRRGHLPAAQQDSPEVHRRGGAAGRRARPLPPGLCLLPGESTRNLSLLVILGPFLTDCL